MHLDSLFGKQKKSSSASRGSIVSLSLCRDVSRVVGGFLSSKEVHSWSLARPRFRVSDVLDSGIFANATQRRLGPPIVSRSIEAVARYL